MTEDKTFTKIHRAARAQALLEDDLFKECLDAVEAAFIKRWQITEPRDTQGRELMWHGLQGLTLFRDALRRIITDGKIAQRALDELIIEQERKERVR